MLAFFLVSTKLFENGSKSRLNEANLLGDVTDVSWNVLKCSINPGISLEETKAPNCRNVKQL